MPDLAELNLVINSSQANAATSALKRLEDASKRAESASYSLSASSEKVAGSMGNLIGLAARLAAGYGLLALAQKAIGEAAWWEKTQIGFETLLGSADKAQKMMLQIQQFANETPFEMRGLAENAKLLMAMGFEAEKVLPALRAIGNASSLLGGEDTIRRISVALGQMQSKQKVQAEEMMQLTEAGINAWDILAKAIGVDVPTAMKMASKGMLDSTQTVNAILAGIEGRFGSGMIKGATTLEGRMSTFKDTVTQMFREVGQALEKSFQINDKIKQATDWMNTIVPLVTDIVRVLGGLPPKWEANAAAANYVADAIRYIGIAFAALIGIKIGVWLAEITIGMIKMGLAIVSNIPLMSALFIFLGALATVEIGRYFYNEFKDVRTSVKDTVADLQFAWAYIKYGAEVSVTAIGLAFSDLWSGIQKGWIVAQGDLEKGWNYISYGFKVAWEAVKYAFDTMTQGVKSSFGLMLRDLASGIAWLESLGVGLGGAGKGLGDFANSLLGKGGTNNWDATKGKLDADLEASNQAVTQKTNTAYNSVSKANLDDLGDYVKGFNQDLQTELNENNEMWRSWGKDIDKEFGSRTSKGRDFTEFLKNDFSALTDFIKSNAGTLVGSLTSSLSVLTDWKKAADGQVKTAQDVYKAMSNVSSFAPGLQGYMTALSSATGITDDSWKTHQFKVDKSKLIRPGDNKAAQKGLDSLNQLLDQSQQEIDTIGKTADERERLNKIFKAEEIMKKAGLEDDQKALDILDQYKKKLGQIETLKKIQEIADDLGKAFSGAFEDFILGAKSAQEAVKNLAQEIEKIAVKALVTKPLEGFLSSFFGNIGGSIFGGATTGKDVGGHSYSNLDGGTRLYAASALGNLFRYGSMIPFANGGVVGGPTTFPMSGGHTGLMGERGPEAIMPLTRGSDGKLGVASPGGSSGPVIQNHYHTWNIQTPDANSFRLSKRQIASNMRSVTG